MPAILPPDTSAYALAGLAIKTLLAVMVLTWLVELVAFRRLRPLLRATCTVGLAGLIAAAVAGALAHTGQPRWHGIDLPEALRYLPAAIIVWLLYWRSLAKAYRDEQD